MNLQAQVYTHGIGENFLSKKVFLVPSTSANLSYGNFTAMNNYIKEKLHRHKQMMPLLCSFNSIDVLPRPKGYDSSSDTSINNSPSKSPRSSLLSMNQSLLSTETPYRSRTVYQSHCVLLTI